MREKIMLVIGAAKGLAAKPGIEQVSFSPAKELIAMAVDGTEAHPLTKECICRIGKSPGYDKRRLFLHSICGLHDRRVLVMKKIIAGKRLSMGAMMLWSSGTAWQQATGKLWIQVNHAKHD